MIVRDESPVQNKKPVYKKWWFLLLVLLVLGGGAYAVWYFVFQKKTSNGGSKPPSDCENGIGEDGECTPKDGDGSSPGGDSPPPAPPKDDTPAAPPTKPEGKNKGRTAGIAVGTVFAVAFMVGAVWLYKKERHAGVTPTPGGIGEGTFVPIIKPGGALETIEEEVGEFARRPKRLPNWDNLYNPPKRKRPASLSELYHDSILRNIENEKIVLKWATEALAREAVVGDRIAKATHASYINDDLSGLERGWRGKMEPLEIRPKLIQHLISEWASAVPIKDKSPNLKNPTALDDFYKDHEKSTSWLENKIKGAKKNIKELEKNIKKTME